MLSNCTSNLFLFVPFSLQLVLFPHFKFQPTLCYIEPSPNLSFLPFISSPFLSLPHVLSWPGIGPSRIGRTETCKAKLRPSKLNTCLTMDFLEVLQSTHMQHALLHLHLSWSWQSVFVPLLCLSSLHIISHSQMELWAGCSHWTCPLAELLIFMNFSHHT